MSYAPIVFISAKTGQRVDKLMELIKYVDAQNAMRVTTGKLNDYLADLNEQAEALFSRLVKQLSEKINIKLPKNTNPVKSMFTIL